MSEHISALPTLEERKSIGIFKNYKQPFYGEDNAKFTEGLYFHHWKDKDGKIELIDTWLASPMEVIAKTIDQDGNAGKLIEFVRWDNFNTETLLIQNGDLYDSYNNPIMKQLANRGVKIRLGNQYKQLLLTYLHQTEVTVMKNYTDRTGWADNEQTFVLPDETIGNEHLFIDHNNNHRYQSKGTVNEWSNTIGKLSQGNPIVQLAIMASFAGALLKDVGMSGGGLHFFGNSGNGKSSSLQAGASVWGHGKHYPIEWKATANGLEQLALLSNDTLIALDELTQTDAKTADNMIYTLANGQPKQRAEVKNKKVTASIVKPWRVMAISAGEKSISDFIKLTTKGALQKAGQAVRFLDIPATTRTYGAFDELHGYEPKELSEAITATSEQYYGTAGREFVRYLLEKTSDVRALHKEARGRITDTPTSTEEDRVIKLFALLCVAGELAVQAGILPWGADEPLKAVQIGFKLWQDERGVKGANLSKIQTLRAFKVKTLRERHLFKNNAKRENEQEIEEFQRYIGWYIHSNGKTEYIFDDDGLHELLEKQIPLSEIVEAFISINALLHDKGKKKTRRTVKGIKKPQYFYCVIAETVYDYLENNEM